jgi:hypothetical protein
MFCPQCGITQSDDVRFCKSCGANLFAVRQAVATRDVGEKFDWSKTWVAEMFMSAEEQKRRKQELEIQRGITPEVKRYTEIKAGVITSCVGVALSIFLYFLMQGIILSGNVDHGAAAIISRIWVAGVFPFFVGIALLFNGVIVSRKLVELGKRGVLDAQNSLEGYQQPPALPSADTNEFAPHGFSVTEGTTKHLKTSSPKK